MKRNLRWTVIIPVGLLALAVLAIFVLDVTEGGEAGSDEYLGVENGERYPYVAPTSTPEGPQPTARPTTGGGIGAQTPVDEGDALERDAQRRGDLLELAGAADTYRSDEGSYPTTGGNVQTLCAYEQLDQGCAFREVLSPLPLDPLGDPVKNGYWYSSDGETARFYASLEIEGTEAERCNTNDAELGKKNFVVCIQAPLQ